MSFGGELNPDGGLGVNAESSVNEPREQVSFTDPRVTDDDNFEKIIKLFLLGHFISQKYNNQIRQGHAFIPALFMQLLKHNKYPDYDNIDECGDKLIALCK